MELAAAVAKAQEAFGLVPVQDSDDSVLLQVNGVAVLKIWCGVSGTVLISYKDGVTNADYFDWNSEQVKQRIAYLQRPVQLPEVVEVTVTNFDYAPGGKWECGTLDVDADTTFGKLEWREVVPGPRHGGDSAELSVKLNGVELTDLDVDLPDFEPPGKPGRWADEFADTPLDDVAEKLRQWLEANKKEVALALG